MLPCLISTVNKNAQKVYPLGYTFRQIIDDTYPQILATGKVDNNKTLE